MGNEISEKEMEEERKKNVTRVRELILNELYDEKFNVVTSSMIEILRMYYIGGSPPPRLKSLLEKKRDTIDGAIKKTESYIYRTFRTKFNRIDTNGDGMIQYDEFNAFVKEMELSIDEKRIKYLFDLFDENGDGVLDFKEFKLWVLIFSVSKFINYVAKFGDDYYIENLLQQFDEKEEIAASKTKSPKKKKKGEEDGEKEDFVEFDPNYFDLDFSKIDLQDSIGIGYGNMIYQAKYQKQKYMMVFYNEPGFFENYKEILDFLKDVSGKQGFLEYKGAFIESQVGYLTEYCKKGNLKEYIDDHPKKLSVKHKLTMLKDLAAALVVTNEMGMVHRNLCLEGIFVKKDLSAKLGSWGRVAAITKKQEFIDDDQLSFYSSPEVILSGRFNENSDVFSFGLCMFVLLSEDLDPFKEEQDLAKEYKMWMKIALNPRFRPKFEDYEVFKDLDDVTDLISSCWSGDKTKRPTFAEISEVLTEVEKDMS